MSLIHCPSFFPPQMRKYGLNDFGEPEYRVIWSDSRIRTIYAEDGAHHVLHYVLNPDIAASWVLERWISGATFGGRPEDWGKNPQNLTNGDFPARGEWEFVACFSMTPSSTAVETVINLSQRGRRRMAGNASENDVFIKDEANRAEQERVTQLRDSLQSRMIPWAAQPVAGAHFSKGTKTQDFELTTRDVGVAPGQSRIGRSKYGASVIVGPDGLRPDTHGR